MLTFLRRSRFTMSGKCRSEQAHINHLIRASLQQAIIASEFQALYSAMRAKQTPDLPPLEVTYADFSTWQRNRLANGQLAGSIAYWKEKLHGVPVLELPTDRPYPQGGLSSAGDSSIVDVPLETASAIRQLATACNTTLYTVLLTAWKARACCSFPAPLRCTA